MRVRVLTTMKGSPDGNRVFTYEEGREYDKGSRPPMSPDLAVVFVAEGWGELVYPAATSDPVPPAPQDGAEAGDPAPSDPNVNAAIDDTQATGDPETPNLTDASESAGTDPAPAAPSEDNSQGKGAGGKTTTRRSRKKTE